MLKISSASQKAFAPSSSNGTGNISFRPAKQTWSPDPNPVFRRLLSKLAKIPLSLQRTCNYQRYKFRILILHFPFLFRQFEFTRWADMVGYGQECFGQTFLKGIGRVAGFCHHKGCNQQKQTSGLHTGLIVSGDVIRKNEGLYIGRCSFRISGDFLIKFKNHCLRQIIVRPPAAPCHGATNPTKRPLRFICHLKTVQVLASSSIGGRN